MDFLSSIRLVDLFAMILGALDRAGFCAETLNPVGRDGQCPSLIYRAAKPNAIARLRWAMLSLRFQRISRATTTISAVSLCPPWSYFKLAAASIDSRYTQYKRARLEVT